MRHGTDATGTDGAGTGREGHGRTAQPGTRTRAYPWTRGCSGAGIGTLPPGGGAAGAGLLGVASWP